MMPRSTTLAPEIALLASHAALGQQLLGLVKTSGLLKPKHRKRHANGDATPRRRRRTKAEMAAARAAERQPVRRPRPTVNEQDDE